MANRESRPLASLNTKPEQDSSPAHSQTNRERISDSGAKRIFRIDQYLIFEY